MGTVDMVWGFANQGFKNFGKVTDPQLDTIGLSGVSGLWLLLIPTPLIKPKLTYPHT